MHKLLTEGTFAPSAFQAKDKISRLLDIRRFKVAFNKKEYEETFAAIQRLNYFLRETTKQNLLFEEKRKRSRPVATALFKRIAKHRRNLKSLRRALEKPSSWLCQCSPRHDVELSIENLKSVCLGEGSYERQRMNIVFHGKSLRVVEIESSDHESTHCATASTVDSAAPIVQLTLSTSDMPILSSGEGRPASNLQRSRTAGTRVVTFSTPSPNNILLSSRSVSQPVQAQISCICTALSSLQQPQVGVCVGHLVDDDLSALHHNVYHIKSKAPKNTNVPTVEELLGVHSEQSSASRVPYSRRARLAAATCLALSVLLLDGSWLRQRWTLADFIVDKESSVHIITNGTTLLKDEIYLPMPIQPAIGSEDEHLRLTEGLRDLRIRCATLFMLGISLIELSLGSPMTKLGFSQGFEEVDLRVNLKTATSLLPRVIDESNLAYGDVVRRCLDCPFDSNDLSLDDPSFQEFVYEKIVSPLLADFRTFQQA